MDDGLTRLLSALAEIKILSESIVDRGANGGERPTHDELTGLARVARENMGVFDKDAEVVDNLAAAHWALFVAQLGLLTGNLDEAERAAGNALGVFSRASAEFAGTPAENIFDAIFMAASTTGESISTRRSLATGNGRMAMHAADRLDGMMGEMEVARESIDPTGEGSLMPSLMGEAALANWAAGRLDRAREMLSMALGMGGEPQFLKETGLAYPEEYEASLPEGYRRMVLEVWAGLGNEERGKPKRKP